MASTAATWGWRVGLGAGLLVTLDALIGIGLTETADPTCRGRHSSWLRTC